MLRIVTIFSALAFASGHGAMTKPLSRNAVDALVGVNTQKCSNITGDACNNGQASFWYSQGCFIGCDECDHKSGRRQTDLCGKGFVGQLPDYAISVNRNSTPGFRNSAYDIYRHNPWRAPGAAPVADPCGLAGGTPWGANCLLYTSDAADD